MSRMVRKHIYIEERQAAQLQRVAQALGIGKGTLIRQAINQFLATGAKRLPAEAGAWADAMRVMRGLQAQGPLPNRRRSWAREDLYAEGEERMGE